MTSTVSYSPRATSSSACCGTKPLRMHSKKWDYRPENAKFADNSNTRNQTAATSAWDHIPERRTYNSTCRKIHRLEVEMRNVMPGTEEYIALGVKLAELEAQKIIDWKRVVAADGRLRTPESQQPLILGSVRK